MKKLLSIGIFFIAIIALAYSVTFAATITASNSETFSLAAGDMLSVAAPSGTTGSVVRLSRIPGGGANQSVTTVNGSDLTFGPYKDSERFNIICTAGTITATTAKHTPYTDSTFNNPTLSGAKFTLAATHVYALAEDWVLSAAEMLCALLITDSGSGDANIIESGGVAGRIRVVRNGANGTVTIKESGETGVSIATGKTAVVMHNGTDYIRVTADATH